MTRTPLFSFDQRTNTEPKFEFMRSICNKVYNCPNVVAFATFLKRSHAAGTWTRSEIVGGEKLSVPTYLGTYAQTYRYCYSVHLNLSLLYEHLLESSCGRLPVLLTQHHAQHVLNDRHRCWWWCALTLALALSTYVGTYAKTNRYSYSVLTYLGLIAIVRAARIFSLVYFRFDEYMNPSVPPRVKDRE